MASYSARWRKPISWLLTLCFVGILTFTTSPGTPLYVLTLEMVGMLLIGAGVLGRIWCALYIAGRKNAELCRDGPYSICRNPLYVFSFFGAVGFTLVARSAPMAIIMMTVFWAYHHFVIRSEESRLRDLFGEEYELYCASVPRLWPQPRLFWSRSRIVIDPQAVARTLREVAWFLVALCAFEVLEHFRGASFDGNTLPTLFIWAF